MHDLSTCCRCEAVPPHQWRRHWKHEPERGAWHLIADTPNLMARLPRQAHYITALAYRAMPDGTRHYRGPLFWEHDSADPAQALEDLRRCLQILDVEYDCSLEAARVWHSGGRGFHGTIQPLVLGAEFGHPQLPRIYRAMIDKLFPPHVAPTLDRSVYSGGRGRMWRLPNRRRENGRYKIRLAVREVLHRPSAEIEALTRQPREGRYWPDDVDLSPCPALVDLYTQVAATMGEKPPTALRPDDGVRIPAGQRNATLTSLAGSMRRRGMTPEAIAAALMAENRLRCDPPLPDAEVERIAASIGRYPPVIDRHMSVDRDSMPLARARDVLGASKVCEHARVILLPLRPSAPYQGYRKGAWHG